MKIEIAQIEEKLEYKIKRNFNTIGFDTATTTGICILRTDDKYLVIEPLVVSFKTEDKKERYVSAVKMFEKLLEDDMYVIVEDVFNKMNVYVTIYLARLGGFAISAAIRQNLDFETILAKSARSKFKIDTMKYGKGKSKLAVADWIKDLGVDIKDDNIADAFVLSLLGMCEGMDFRSQKEIKGIKKKRRPRKLKCKKV